MADLRKLAHILALAEAGNFSVAARQLNITQSALSRSVQSLEAEYGFRIFERGRGPVVPTAAGRALLPDAARLMQDARALDRQAAGIGKAEAGQVPFGMGPLGAITLLPKLIGLMLKERPGIQAHPVLGGGPELVRRTLEDELEFCCVGDIMIPEAERMDTIPIARFPIALIVRAGHPLLEGTGTLEDFPLIGASTADWTPTAYEPTVRCESNAILKTVTMTSNAVWLSAAVAAKAEIAAGTLAILPQAFETPDQEIRLVMVRHSGRTLSPAAQYLERTVRRLAAEL